VGAEVLCRLECVVIDGLPVNRVPCCLITHSFIILTTV